MCRGRQRTKPRIIPKRQTKQKGADIQSTKHKQGPEHREAKIQKKKNTGYTKGKNTGNAGTNAQ